MEDYPTPTYLRNHEAVIAIFGYWPSFHDSPLVRMQISSPPTATLEMVLHYGETTEKPDDHGYYSWIKNHLIFFKFCDVSQS